MKKKIVTLCLILSLFGCQLQTYNPRTDISKDNTSYLAKNDPYYQSKIEKAKDTTSNYINKDVSNLNLNLKKFKYSIFNKNTVFTDQQKEKLQIDTLIELGKNPGLNLTSIHNNNINGSGIDIAIISGDINYKHPEIKESIQSFERIHSYEDCTSLVGMEAASIIAGKTTGVAPKANLYFYNCAFTNADKKINLQYATQCIQRIMKHNKKAKDKIRILVLGIGLSKEDSGYSDYKKAIKEANDNHILVLYPGMEIDSILLTTLKRDPLKNPDDIHSYEIASSYGDFIGYNRIAIPGGQRTVAGITSNDDYCYDGTINNNASVYWLAGLFALCLQINPNLTSQDLFRLIYNTGDEMDQDYKAHAVNPTQLIQELTR